MKNKLIKYTLVYAGAIFFVWFGAPFAVGGILNIGNMTGMTIAFLIFIYGVFFSRINKGVRWTVKRLWGKMILGVISLCLSVIFLLAVIGTALMVASAVRAPEKNTTAVLLGCRVYGERASLMLTERLLAAEEYLRENPNAKCILSGGMGEGEDISEAECMYRWLTSRGVDPDRLYIEDRSTSTRENLEFSKRILTEQGLGNKIAIITNEFHEHRASEIAKELGLQAYSVPASTALWLLPTYYVRDLYGIIYEWVF